MLKKVSVIFHGIWKEVCYMIDYQQQVIAQIKEKMMQQDFEGALSICENPQCIYWSPVQSLRFQLLRIMGRSDEILPICCQKEYQNDIDMVSRRITIMKNSGQDEEALLLCDQYPNSYIIQAQKMHILTVKERYDEAISVSENPCLSDHPSIILQRNKVFALKQQKALEQSQQQKTLKN